MIRCRSLQIISDSQPQCEGLFGHVKDVRGKLVRHNKNVVFTFRDICDISH